MNFAIFQANAINKGYNESDNYVFLRWGFESGFICSRNIGLFFQNRYKEKARGEQQFTPNLLVTLRISGVWSGIADSWCIVGWRG